MPLEAQKTYGYVRRLQESSVAGLFDPDIRFTLYRAMEPSPQVFHFIPKGINPFSWDYHVCWLRLLSL